MAYENYIDGEWVAAESGETATVRNPADLDDVVGEFPASGEADVDAAVAAASAAQSEWAATPAPERGALLRELADELEAREDELAETLTREEGKVLGEAAGEVGHAIDSLRYYSEAIRDFGGDVKNASARDKRLFTRREPVGVVGLIAAWNYPIAIPVWKLGPALAAGNAAVFKPASATPNVMRKVFECIDAVGFPDGVANYVVGSGSEVGSALTSHPGVNAVSFTGSTATGRRVYESACEDQKRVQTEMGGKNPTIVSDSADLEDALDIVQGGAFGVTGQACTATSRAIVYEDVYDEFLEGIVARTESIEVGPGLKGGEMGPQANESELEGTLDYVDVAKEDGATLETGGGRPEAETDGYFVEPTVFSDVDPEMRIAQEEVFGPLLAVIPVSGFEEAVEVANGVDYGLAASIVTQDHSEANRFVDESESGLVKINEGTTGTEVNVPFGGIKDSSSNTFREQGDAGLRFYTRLKTVYDSY
ncbi:2,5-dioxovalerate dehydrogenase [Halocalculus aciditolerans]|uniref:Putative aldehyde dehydrogenase YcbD n=1 Tax=Halocalculus aciditolerans TaxID=1383812 RepID=A0A830FE75_9EURY|nr:aldehyde dehydrogenase family protein [Halocalculus aciditolerans]GGL66609.1 putative aldehyde dehydrogenase YcbD [Halocalculus aciditolerans]